MNWLPVLENAAFALRPFTPADADDLFAVASDPAIWENHPARNRYRRGVFQAFIDSALSEGHYPFLILDKATGEIAGSTRYYEYDASGKSVAIGYTFLAKSYQGSGLNAQVKKLMLDYAFQEVDTVYFYVADTNGPSRKAVEKLGAVLKDDTPATNWEGKPFRQLRYRLKKADWLKTYKVLETL